MSIEGCFDSIIRIWYDKNTKHTPTLKREMKEVLRLFQASRDFFEEIPEDRVDDLTRTFNEIRKEVYET